MGLTAEESRFDSRQGQKISVFTTVSRWTVWPSQPLIYRGPFPCT